MFVFVQGDVEGAREDCRLLSQWRKAIENDSLSSVPEILAYLTVYDGDVRKAWNAMNMDLLKK